MYISFIIFLNIYSIIKFFLIYLSINVFGTFFESLILPFLSPYLSNLSLLLLTGVLNCSLPLPGSLQVLFSRVLFISLSGFSLKSSSSASVTPLFFWISLATFAQLSTSQHHNITIRSSVFLPLL